MSLTLRFRNALIAPSRTFRHELKRFDEIPVEFCSHESYGETLLLAVAGIVSCGCRFVTGGADSIRLDDLIGVNEELSLEWDDASQAWQAAAGEATHKGFDSGTDCAGAPSNTEQVFFTAFIQCVDPESDRVRVRIAWDFIERPTFPGNGVQVFDGEGTLGEVIPNTMECALSDENRETIGGGTATPSLP